MATYTTVQDIYQTVCWVLMEDNGLELGIVTEQQFLDTFAAVFLEFVQKTGITSEIFTQQINAGQSQYMAPPDMVYLQHCFYGGVILSRETLEELDNETYNWRLKSGTPTKYHEDGLPIKTVELVPTPNYTGTAYTIPVGPDAQPPFGVYGVFNPGDSNLTMVGSQSITYNTFTLGQLIPVIPDSACLYLGYGVLQTLFSTDGEAKDTQRAQYAAARWNEGLNIFQTVSGQLNG